MRTTTEELVAVRAQMQSMGEELTRFKESADTMATKGQQSNVTTEPFVTTKKKATPEPEPELAVEEALKTGTESAQEIKTLREELAAHEAPREKEREQRRLVEDERRRIEEGLRKSHASNDRMMEERDKLQQDKERGKSRWKSNA